MASMAFTNGTEVAKSIRSELETTRSTFHSLLRSLSEEDLRRPSFNRGWTNGEILAHMLFGFIILKALLPLTRIWGRFPKSSSKPFAKLLNFATRTFNWFNAFGARMQARVFTYNRLEILYDRVYFSLLKSVDSIQDEEWNHGMYYPAKWDSNFSEYMTIEKLFHYPVLHFNFHLTQISR
jgi:DinB superfamily